MLSIHKYIPQLSTLYSEPHRYYHSLTHVHSLYRTIVTERWKSLVKPQHSSAAHRTHDLTEMLSFIAWFHDCYYDPYLAPPHNETISANMFKVMVSPDVHKDDGYTALFVEDVIAGIKLTARHLEGLNVGRHMFAHILFLDLDMMGFAFRDEHLANNIAIRKEYYKTSDADYLSARIGFLQALLKKDRIYYLFQDHLELSARANIKESIDADSRALDILGA